MGKATGFMEYDRIPSQDVIRKAGHVTGTNIVYQCR